jgi:hypothetical protein
MQTVFIITMVVCLITCFVAIILVIKWDKTFRDKKEEIKYLMDVDPENGDEFYEH